VNQPKISIVTPCFNQAAYLEETIQSILGQKYANLEYIIVDGGSTDGTVEIIKRYAPQLAWWVSESDGGQYDAINKGFARATGEIFAWINADDTYLPWTLKVVAQIFSSIPQAEWISSLFPVLLDEKGAAFQCAPTRRFGQEAFWRGEYLPECGWYAVGWIQQESTFWRRSLWERAGGRLDTKFQLAGDFELWARFYKEADLIGVPTPLATFRFREGQRSQTHFKTYLEEARSAFQLHGGRPPKGFESWSLRKLHKIIRFLERLHRRRTDLLHPDGISVRKLRTDLWEIRPH